MCAALFMLMSGPADATMTPTMTKEIVGAEVLILGLIASPKPWTTKVRTSLIGEVHLFWRALNRGAIIGRGYCFSFGEHIQSLSHGLPKLCWRTTDVRRDSV